MINKKANIPLSEKIQSIDCNGNIVIYDNIRSAMQKTFINKDCISLSISRKGKTKSKTTGIKYNFSYYSEFK